MTASRTATARIFKARTCKATWLSLATLLLTACAGEQAKPPSSASTQTQTPGHSARKPWKPLGSYTAGGLYAPGVSDGAPEVPPDVANLPEPVPRPEPLSHYGNRSPYVVLGKTYNVLPSASGYVERGMASWYGTKFDGRVTSSFEPYDLSQFTAAHRTLPLPCFARVTNLENGRSVIVRINDRGPFHEGRLIDLSYAAAIKLGVNVHGTAMVEVRGIDTSQIGLDTSSDLAASKPPPPHPNASVPRPAPPKPYASRPIAASKTVSPMVPAAGAAAPPPAPDVASASDDTSPPVAAARQVESSRQDSPSTSDGSTPPIQAATTRPATDAATTAAVDILPESAATPPATTNTAADTLQAPVPAALPSAPATAGSVVAPTPPQALAAAVAVAGLLPATIVPGSIPGATAAPRSVLPTPLAPSVPSLIGHPGIDASTPGFLQLASYGDRANAERMLQRLQQAGIEHAELLSVQVADQTLWRVHIGPMRADEAERVAAHLDELGFGTPPFFKE